MHIGRSMAVQNIVQELFLPSARPNLKSIGSRASQFSSVRAWTNSRSPDVVQMVESVTEPQSLTAKTPAFPGGKN